MAGVYFTTTALWAFIAVLVSLFQTENTFFLRLITISGIVAIIVVFFEWHHSNTAATAPG